MTEPKTYPLSEKYALRLANLLNLKQELSHKLELAEIEERLVMKDALTDLGLSVEKNNKYHFDTTKCTVTDFTPEPAAEFITKKSKKR